MKKPRYHCNACSFGTDVRVVMKDHAAMLGHFGWTDSEAKVEPDNFDLNAPDSPYGSIPWAAKVRARDEVGEFLETEPVMTVGFVPTGGFRNLTDPVERVVALWNEMDGWIPGAAYTELAEALGVSTDRLVHYDNENRRRYYPEGHPRRSHD